MMTMTTFRERLEIEYANADAKYCELSAIAETMMMMMMCGQKFATKPINIGELEKPV